MENDWGIFWGGMVVALLGVMIGFRVTEINISDEELYRFCIVQKIELEDCKVPPLYLPKEATDGK